MSEDKIISFATRKPQPTPEEIARTKEVERELAEAQEQEEASEHFTRMHQTLNDIVGLVDGGEMSSYVFIGRKEKDGPFLTEFTLDPRRMAQFDVYSWIGILESVKLELLDIANTAPIMISDGTVIESATTSYAAFAEDEE